MPNTQVTSLADIVAPSLAGPCIDERAAAVSVEGDSPVLLVEDDGELSEEPVPQLKAHRIEALARALFTPYDKSAGLLLYGAIGLVAVFLIETITAVFVLDNSAVDAIYGSAKTLVTVDPNLDVDKGPGWYKLFTSLTMLVALVFAAGFTAGLVNRVVDRRLTGLRRQARGPSPRSRRRRRPRPGRHAALPAAPRAAACPWSRSNRTRRAATSASRASSACRW